LAARVRDALLPLRAEVLREDDEPDPDARDELLREELLRDDDEPDPLRAEELRDALLREEALRDDDEPDPELLLLRAEPEPPLLRADPLLRDDPPPLPPLPELRFDSAISLVPPPRKYARDHATLNRAATGA
jgi:hypothetical protein